MITITMLQNSTSQPTKPLWRLYTSQSSKIEKEVVQFSTKKEASNVGKSKYASFWTHDVTGQKWYFKQIVTATEEDAINEIVTSPLYAAMLDDTSHISLGQRSSHVELFYEESTGFYYTASKVLANYKDISCYKRYQAIQEAESKLRGDSDLLHEEMQLLSPQKPSVFLKAWAFDAIALYWYNYKQKLDASFRNSIEVCLVIVDDLFLEPEYENGEMQKAIKEILGVDEAKYEEDDSIDLDAYRLDMGKAIKTKYGEDVVSFLTALAEALHAPNARCNPLKVYQSQKDKQALADAKLDEIQKMRNSPQEQCQPFMQWWNIPGILEVILVCGVIGKGDILHNIGIIGHPDKECFAATVDHGFAAKCGVYDCFGIMAAMTKAREGVSHWNDMNRFHKGASLDCIKAGLVENSDKLITAIEVVLERHSRHAPTLNKELADRQRLIQSITTYSIWECKYKNQIETIYTHYHEQLTKCAKVLIALKLGELDFIYSTTPNIPFFGSFSYDCSVTGNLMDFKELG